ncbi:MAG TPA: bifunctional acetaldehyde-CoA/alcohol dehydrogenase [Rickettsiales bacterium]|nr:bifunctional acetaldehyde-CoA/alcohol dehydrogenase [Rickettsiales bacterium]
MVNIVNSIESLDALMKKVKEAQRKFATYTQEQVDAIFKRTALLANTKRIELAKMAVAETGMGVVEDKVIKNHYAAEYIYNSYKNTKTCGVIEKDLTHGMIKIADPIGVIAGVIPTTNPTSTAIFKCLIALKTRNAIVFSPHPRAKKCTIEALKVVVAAAKEAGAPDNLIGWIDEPTIELSNALMNHPDIDLILATGGPGMVKAAYSCGKPALGVGAGNSPAVIDETANVEMAVSSIILSKIFDNGMICASEQSIVVVKDKYDEVKKEFEKRGCYFLKSPEKAKMEPFMFQEGKLNAGMVGQSACKIAEMAGIKVPAGTKILIGEAKDISLNEAFAKEKLSPILGFYKAEDFEDAVKKARDLVNLGGEGHTSILYTNQQIQDRIDYFSNIMNTGRILINTPSSFGGIGDVFNFTLNPSLTLGCGSWGHNSVSENVGVKHLLNIKTVAMREENMLWFRVPPKVYFKKGATKLALAELKGKQKAVIITDKILFQLGVTKKVTDELDKIGVKYTIFSDVEPDPNLSMVNRAIAVVRSFEPDLIIAMGGGSPIDAAKIVWLMYEQPQISFADVAMRFMDIRKRIFSLPNLGEKADLVCIPTTSGTGSEVTPFAVITDDSTGVKYPLADYAFMPSMAIVDTDFVMTMPKGLAAASGIDAVSHAIEAYGSIMASPFTDGLALEALKLLFKHLAKSVNEGTEYDREQIHYAATIAGMAFANAFLGISHSMAHKLGAHFHVPHGIANAYVLCQIMRFNASEKPTKQAAFAQHKYPNTKHRYAEIADTLELGGKNDDEKLNNLIKAIQDLKTSVGVKLSMKDAGIKKEDLKKELEKGLAEEAYDDQCTGANPRYPLISELEQLYWKAFEGETDFDI